MAVIPASAATADGRVSILGEGDRLEEVTVKVLRHQDNNIIGSDVPIDRSYVVKRSPQNGAGIQAQPLKAVEIIAGEIPADTAAPETVVLNDERRAKLIAFIEASENMAAESKARVLGELALPEVSLELVIRFESKMEQ